jgi:hypothetical protein
MTTDPVFDDCFDLIRRSDRLCVPFFASLLGLCYIRLLHSTAVLTMAEAAPSATAVLVCVWKSPFESCGRSMHESGVDLADDFRCLGHVRDPFAHRACHDMCEVLPAYQDSPESATASQRSADGCCVVCGLYDSELRRHLV